MPPSSSSPIPLGAATTYLVLQLLLHRALQTRPRSLSSRDALLAASKLVGGTHALLVGNLALREILDARWLKEDLIHSKSERGERFVALEAGYLIGDTLFLLAKRDTLRDPRFLRRVLAHHVVVASLMLTYLRTAARGRAKGIFFVSSFLIMNLSTPLRYVVWAMRKFGRDAFPRALILGVHSLAMAVYAMARFGLLYYQLHVYGARKGLSWFEALTSLPVICRTGITILVLANGVRFTQIAAARGK